MSDLYNSPEYMRKLLTESMVNERFEMGDSVTIIPLGIQGKVIDANYTIAKYLVQHNDSDESSIHPVSDLEPLELDESSLNFRDVFSKIEALQSMAVDAIEDEAIRIEFVQTLSMLRDIIESLADDVSDYQEPPEPPAPPVPGTY